MTKRLSPERLEEIHLTMPYIPSTFDKNILTELLNHIDALEGELQKYKEALGAIVRSARRGDYNDNK